MINVYTEIRGRDSDFPWPETETVDKNSFVGRIQDRTGLNFDMPTEAQWEYACRAGTKTAFYWGNVADDNYAWYGWSPDSYSTCPVGMKIPNAWGLYDMAGNAFEYCLNWYDSSKENEKMYGIDPKGGTSRSWNRVFRGGGLGGYGSGNCQSFSRSSTSFFSPRAIGFRLSRTLP